MVAPVVPYQPCSSLYGYKTTSAELIGHAVVSFTSSPKPPMTKLQRVVFCTGVGFVLTAIVGGLLMLALDGNVYGSLAMTFGVGVVLASWSRK